MAEDQLGRLAFADLGAHDTRVLRQPTFVRKNYGPTFFQDFFQRRPGAFLPPGNRGFIQRDRAAAGALKTPTHLPQGPPSMVGMQLHLALAFDQCRNPG